MEPRRRRIRATYKQLKLLVKFMADNPFLAKGVDYRTAFGKHYHDSKWTELANLMNAQENGMNKSPREWNRYWKDLKSGVKKKVHSMKMRPGQRKIVLSSIEQVIYKNMCDNKNKKGAIANDKTRSYLQIPPESDTEVENYEIEYLEESSCDETQLNNISSMEPATNLAFNNTINLNDFNSDAGQRNVKSEILVDDDSFLIETLLNDTNFNTQREKSTEDSIRNHETANNVADGGVVKLDHDKNPDILTEIRDQLKELVELNKDKAKSAQRLAAAFERRAILEEKRVRIEERRLKIEERRVALEERKMEAAEKRSFAEERLATAAERRNDLEEHRMANT